MDWNWINGLSCRSRKLEELSPAGELLSLHWFVFDGSFFAINNYLFVDEESALVDNRSGCVFLSKS